MRVRLKLSALALLALASCGPLSSLQLASSGHIGCPPEEIVISNDHLSFGARAWQGSCRARTYQCSSMGNTMSCVQLLAPTALPAAPPPPNL